MFTYSERHDHFKHREVRNLNKMIEELTINFDHYPFSVRLIFSSLHCKVGVAI